MSCGYELAQLPAESLCPECGDPIGWTIHAVRLEGWDPDRLRQIAESCRWAWSVPLAMAGCLVFGGCFAFGGGGAGGSCVAIIGLAAMVFAGAASAIAWSTILQPADRPRFSPGPWRIVAVVAGIAVALSYLGLGMLSLLRPDVSPGPMIALLFGAALAPSVHAAAAMLGLRRLTVAMRRARWARWARVLAVCAFAPALLIAAAYTVLLVALANYGGANGPSSTESLVSVIATIIFFSSAIVAVATVIGGGILIGKVRATLVFALAERSRE